MMQPGVDPIVYCAHPGVSAQWLYSELYSIFGANLLGLWLGEDMLVNSSNEVTSWPGRVGPELTYSPNSVGKYVVTSLNGRLAFWNGGLQDLSFVTNQKSLRGTLSTPPKSLWAFSKITTMGNSAYGQHLIVAEDNNTALIKAENASSWLATVWTTNRSGLLHTGVESGVPRLYHAEYASNTKTGVSVGGIYSDIVGRQAWQHPCSFCMALGAVPTALQQILATIAIKLFCGEQVTPQEYYIRDIVQALGTDLNSMYVIDDADLNGSNQVTLIRTRFAGAGNLVPYLTNYYSTTTVGAGARRVMYAPNRTSDGKYSGFPAVSPVVHSVLCVAAVPNLPFPNYSTLYRANVGWTTLLGDSGTSSWYTSGQDIRHYVDSQTNVASAVVTAGLHLLGGSQIDPAPVGDAPDLGGSIGYAGARNWDADIACVMQLRTNVESIAADKFNYVLQRSQQYYAGAWGA